MKVEWVAPNKDYQVFDFLPAIRFGHYSEYQNTLEFGWLFWAVWFVWE